jgi:hypothetical protein
MKDKHFTSRMLTCAGALMSISGILIAICAKLAYGGILFAADACMFFAARNFRIAEDKNQDAETEQEKEYAISAGKKKKEKQSDNYGTEGMCVGMCLGTAIGTAIGNNTGIGISLGMLIGLAIGTSIKKEV